MTGARVVVYGPPLAGKTTLLETIRRVASGELQAFEIAGEEQGSRADSHRGVLLRVEGLGGKALELVTIPGGVRGGAPWRRLAATATATIVVLDLQPERLEANRRCLEEAHAELPLSRGLVLFTKADLLRPDDVDAAAANLTGSLSGCLLDWPRLIFRKDDDASVRCAVRRIRELLD